MKVVNWHFQNRDTLVLSFSNKIMTSEIYFEQRQHPNRFFLPKRLYGNFVDEKTLSFKIFRFLKQSDDLSEEDIFDLIYSSDRIIEMIQPDSKFEKREYSFDNQSFFIYTNARKGLSFCLPKNDLSHNDYRIETVKCDEKELTVSIKMTRKYARNQNLSLLLKQRQAPNIIEYIYEIEETVGVLDSQTIEFKIPLDILFGNSTIGDVVFDFFLVVADSVISLKNEGTKLLISMLTGIDGYLYRNYAGNTSMTVRQRKTRQRDVDEKFDFYLYKVVKTSNSEIFICDSKMHDKSISEAMSYIVNHQSSMTYIIVEDDGYLKCPVNFVFDKSDIRYSKLEIRQKHYGTRIFCNDMRQKKILVQGSCHSRLMFTSTDFYNKNYKDHFQVSYTQFHSSLVTLATPPYEGNLELLQNLGDKFERYVQADLSKEMFKYLKLNTVDYLLVDLFVDAVRDQIMVDGSGITVNYLIRKNRDLLYRILSEENGIVIDKGNIQEYFIFWKKHADVYADIVHEYLSDSQIILNRVTRTLLYRDREGNIKQFENREYINKTNVLLAMMEDYFISLFPGCKVLENNREYISDETHPEYKSPDHLESQYYKDRMNELIRMVEYK